MPDNTAAMQTKEEEGPGDHPAALIRVALAFLLGLAVELLFDGHPWGISVPILTALAIAALFISARNAGTAIKVESLALAFLALLAGTMFVLRAEPFTSVLNVLTVLVSLTFLVRTFRMQGLKVFGWLDYALTLLWVPLEAWIRPWRDLQSVQVHYLTGESKRVRWLAVLRGILLAFPILLVFLLLLVSADLVFGDLVEKALNWLDIELFFRWLGRITLVVLSGLFFLGAIVAALRDASGRRVLRGSIEFGRRILGFTEAAIVLGSVNVLFALFVVVQFAYLFGGVANVATTGYTYSAYARRGFGELLFAAALVLAMIFVIETVTDRADNRRERAFRMMSGTLVAFTIVILASAYMRLLLYEQAYGFTRSRLEAHVFMAWLGVLLIGFVVMLAARRLAWFVHLVGLAALGFILTLNMLNVDRLIVLENLKHMRVQEDLDAIYLSGLSADSIPAVLGALDQIPRDDWDVIVADLACTRRRLTEAVEQRAWPSYRLPIWRAVALLADADEELSAAEMVEEENGQIKYVVNEQERYCYDYLDW